MTLETNGRQERVAGLIYAGGRGMRMGGVDKALIMHEGAPLIAHMARALAQFGSPIFITRQSDQASVSPYGQVIVDDTPDQGPLAGLVAAIHAAQGYDYLLTVAVDSLGLPENYDQALKSVARPHAMAQTGDEIHPTFALIDLRKSAEIVEIYQSGERRLRTWAKPSICGYAIFATGELKNINQ